MNKKFPLVHGPQKQFKEGNPPKSFKCRQNMVAIFQVAE